MRAIWSKLRLLPFLCLATLGMPAMAWSTDLFVATHRCAVTQFLTRIHELKAPTDGFLVLALDRAHQAYVQCLSVEEGRHILCEASSEYYAVREGHLRLRRMPTDDVANLARLGFDTTVSQGNYRQWFEGVEPRDIPALADLLLTTLAQGYGARLDDPIEITAPLLGLQRSTLWSPFCHPLAVRNVHCPTRGCAVIQHQ